MKRKVLAIAGIVVLVIVLIAAAYIGGQMLNRKGQATAGAGPQMLLNTNSSNGQGQTFRLNTTPAQELPQEPVTAQGIFVRRSDSSIFIGTGMLTMTAQRKTDGTMSMASQHDGPDVEVVVTHDTVIYRDVSLKQFNGAPPAGDTTLKQVVEAGTIDEISDNCTLQVWGQKTGDRITAGVLVYSLPALFTAPGGG